jgi:hypothetical protein
MARLNFSENGDVVGHRTRCGMLPTWIVFASVSDPVGSGFVRDFAIEYHSTSERTDRLLPVVAETLARANFAFSLSPLTFYARVSGGIQG